MRTPPPPIQFLLLVLGTWVTLRTVAVTLKHWLNEEPVPIAWDKKSGPATFARRASMHAGPVRIAPILLAPLPGKAPPTTRRQLVLLEASTAPQPEYPTRDMPPDASPSIAPSPGPIALAPALPSVKRWSGAAWLLLRDDAAGALAPGGSLGGGQAGLRLTFALTDHVALSGRAYLPVNAPSGTEAAFGLDWQPSSALPVRILAERRQAIGRTGRSAFGLTVYGGISDQPVAGPVSLDSYVQAGVVGLRSRDLFADGAASVTIAQGPLKVGVGIWAAAQPGVERVDLGPHLSVRTKFGTVSADWRFRVAGDAEPGSGPALTLARDF